jgi:hypothetical protein
VGLSKALVSLSRRDGHLGDLRGTRQAAGVPARIHYAPDRSGSNNSIRQIGEHGFELVIGHRLFDAFDAATRVRLSSSTTVCNAMSIDCIDLAQLIDEEDWVLRYRLAGSNIPCNSTPLNHLYRGRH